MPAIARRHCLSIAMGIKAIAVSLLSVVSHAWFGGGGNFLTNYDPKNDIFTTTYIAIKSDLVKVLPNLYA